MKWIDDIVTGLVEVYGTRDVYELCDCLEIQIRSLDPSNILLHGHEAFYYRYQDGTEIIFLSNALENPLKDFVLKHELGHALCNADILSVGFTYSNVNKSERQANYFALKLSNIVLDEVDLREMTLEQIASYIGIPYKPLKQVISI